MFYMELSFTKHPILEAPSDEDIVALGEMDPQLLVPYTRLTRVGFSQRRRIHFVTDLSYRDGVGCGMP